MIFSLEVLRARKGDCLLLHLGTADDPGLVLIDGGPITVYDEFLAPRLRQIRQAREFGPEDLLQFDLIMVSHADDDHIRGILDLTTKEIDEGRQIVAISLWHNSFDTVMRKAETELRKSLPKAFGAASLEVQIPDAIVQEVEDSFADDQQARVRSSLKILASMKQGFRLRDNAKRLGFPLNGGFPGELIMAWKGAPKVVVGEGKVELSVLGPLQPELAKLQKQHVKWLNQLRKAGKTPADMLAAYVDQSPTNLSSIVVLAEVGKKKMLLTGDARGDKILEGLELGELLSSDDREPFKVDILKVPHHGSSNNLEDDFFERIEADHYVFSGDGEHGNPERETLEMLLRARGNAKYNVHLTYPVAHIDSERRKDWDKERKKELKRHAKNKKNNVREEWSDKTHSIAAFLADNPAFANKIRVVQENEPHLIELSDPLQPR